MTAVAVENEVVRTARPTPTRIPMSRIVAVELRKSFDTRSGFWLMMSIGILAVVATTATILFAPDDQLTYDSFAASIGFPMAVVLPVIAVLSVTSEWSQRTGLTSFTLVPHRGRVVRAKLAVTVGVGVASMLLAAAVGAVGNVLGSTIAGVPTTWDVTAIELAYIVLANVLGMLIGFMLGVLLRNSAAAIVGYFVISFVLVPLSALLAQSQAWFEKAQPWVDFNFAQGYLFNGDMGGAHWAQLGVASVIWLVIPMTIGLWGVLRAEVK
ncbi:ABC transporter permease [Nocardioides aquiterrae]|uniref:ABC transporter permease n=1 Tax=Nocardioides aquiterrae TaxID=203799 RepID=A0ABN1UNA9_9ACTN